MEKADVVVIGAGVVGLSIGARLSESGRNVYVLEKHESFGQETSSRNSEVIHAGIYYPAESLKAKLCVCGNKLLYEICAKHRIPHKRTGKLIVAVNNDEEEILEDLLKKGRENGCEGLEIISGEAARKLEPNIKVKSALYSPWTGIVDTHALMRYFVFKLKENGGDVVYNSEVAAINKQKDGYELTIQDNSGEEFKFHANVVINSAGLNSDTISRMAGIDNGGQNYDLKYCKGQYFRVSAKKSRFISRLVYPVPHEGHAGLGVHATLDLSGSLRLGPDAKYIDRKDINYTVDTSVKREFYESAVKFMPFIEEEDLTPDTAGIRPKLQGPNENFCDFIIREESRLGLPGFINLIGIESPGLTSAPAIGEYVQDIVS